MSKINPYIYSQWIFDKGAKTIQWGKYSVLNTGAEITGGPHIRVKLHSFFIPYSKNYLQLCQRQLEDL